MSRAEQKAQTRSAILAAARARFAADGFGATTIRAVAQAAEVSVGAVHAHFRDKDGLLFACFLDQIDEAVAAGWRTLPADAPLLDALCHLAQALYTGYARHPDLSRAMFQASLFPEPAARAATAAHVGAYLVQVAALCTAAARRGALAPQPDGGLLAAQGYFSLYVSTLIAGLAGHLGAPDAPDAPAQWTAALRPPLAVWLRGLGAAPDLDAPSGPTDPSPEAVP